ncbi:uncharacterized protein DS421_6g172680 [Arachis hypogaea]|nr:uncharacterized protein DS421_6g172680 [Arachis hypogaea]
MAKHQLNRADRRSTAINTKLRRLLPPTHDDIDHRTHQGLHSRYLAFNNMTNDERDKIARADSKKFELIFGEIERLHQLVTKSREQVADAKALLDITKSLVMSVKGHANGVVTPSEFGGQGGSSTSTEGCTRISIAWNDVGLSASHVFKAGSSCCTINGPIYAKVMQRKAVNYRSRKRVRPNELARLEELVKLENLILNRNSFAQIVENLFALSFLVKDGLAEIKVNEAGSQLVESPRNRDVNGAGRRRGMPPCSPSSPSDLLSIPVLIPRYGRILLLIPIPRGDPIPHLHNSSN